MNPPDDELGLLWEAYADQGEPRGRLLEQIVVRLAEGARPSIPFNVNWSPHVLREALRARGADAGILEEIYLDPEKVEQARPTLSAVFPGFQAQHFGRDGAGQQQRRIVFENRLGDVYLRGLAKIAFHGALKFLPQLDGAHGNFAPVRHWIKGTAPRPAGMVRLERDAILQDVGHGIVLADWGHVIAVESDYARIRVRLQFYIGPARIPGT